MNGSAQAAQPGAGFWRFAFLLAGTVGLIEIVPLYFLESTLSRTQPPPLTHAEFYYGFLGIVVAWQIAFLIISSDPARYRPLFPALVLEKLLYPLTVFTLYAQGRVTSGAALAGPVLDLVWLTLFVTAWVKTRPRGGAGAV